jgi:hypothetical protein
MGGAGPSKPTEMADGAGRCRKIVHRQRAWISVPIVVLTVHMIRDSMGGLHVDLPLRVIRADVTGIAGLGLASLLQAEFVTQVALLALPDRVVSSWLANRMADLAGEAGDVLAFQGSNGIALFIRSVEAFRY